MPRGVIEKVIEAADVATINTDTSACAGMLYRTSDTDEFYFGGANGTLVGPIALNVPRFYDTYPDDETAGLNDVPVGGIYFLTLDNEYGMPAGIARKRQQP